MLVAAELRATGQTVHARSHDAATELTVQELAAIVAEGATNREGADRMFLSPRTVEYHLPSVFTKLGLSSQDRAGGGSTWNSTRRNPAEDPDGV